MTKVFDDPTHKQVVYSPARLRVIKTIFVELCEEHNLPHAHQFKRDTLALALLEAAKVSTEEAVLRTAGLEAIILG